MCGRFNLKTSARAIAQRLGFDTNMASIPRYNIAPSQQILGVREDDSGVRELSWFYWGFIPRWTKDKRDARKPINARAETAWQSPFFRHAFKRQRCLIPTNGFYEWQTTDKGKQPFLIHLIDDDLFFFAGLWERWISFEGEVIESATILTTHANKVAARIHSRMPVILAKDAYEPWLNPTVADNELLRSLLQPYPNDGLDIYPVSTIVNSARNETKACIDPLDPEEE